MIWKILTVGFGLAILCWFARLLFARRWFNYRIQRRRFIFRFWDGERRRAGDPLQIHRTLKTDPEFVLDEHPAYVEAGHIEETEIMLRALCRAFNVKRFEDGKGGLTDQELLSLFGHFSNYMEAVQKKTNPSSNSSPPTGPESSNTSSDAMAPSPTSNSADSPSAETLPSPSTPTEASAAM